MKNIPLLTLILLVAAAARADTVVMRTLETIDGEIISKNDDFIELQVEYGIMRVPLDKVLRIEAETPETKAAKEAKAAEAKEFAAKMAAEGKMLYKGKWVTEEEKAADEAKLAALKKQRDEDRKKKEAELAAKKALELKQQQQAQAAQLAQQQALDAQAQAQRKSAQNSQYRNQIGNMNTQQTQTILNQSGNGF